MINQPNSRTFEFENRASTNEKMLFHIFLFIISRKSPILHSFHFCSFIKNRISVYIVQKNYCIFLFDVSIHIIPQSYTPDILFLSIENVAMRYKAFRLSIELRHNKKKISPTFRTITAHFAP